MDARLETLSKENPVLYDNTPTAEQVLEERHRIKAQAETTALRPKNPEPNRTLPAKSTKRSWRFFG